MTGSLKKTTSNYNLKVPNFDTPQWGRYIEENMDVIDALIFTATSINNVDGIWVNNNAYVNGDRVVDNVNGVIRECLVNHTSAATGTFADDRAANPTYWSSVQNVITNAGTWAATTAYTINDIIDDGGNKIGLVQASYTSGGVSFDADVTNGDIHELIDLDPQLAATAADVIASAASAAAALVSENAAAADLVLTNADVAGTNADVISTNADVVLTNADAALTTLDKIATNADVVTTTQDAIDTAADVVTTNADVILTAADAVSTAASYDAFDDRYLGSKTIDPTLDNDGDALLTGAMYWNSVANETRIYSGSAWVAAYVPASIYALLSGMGIFTGHRNRLINGDFDIWQRAISQTASGYGSVDRWKLTVGTGAACTISSVTHTLGQTDVTGSPRFYMSWARATAGTTSSIEEQRIEGVKIFAGKTATVTFHASASAATEILHDITQSFGTSGSPSSDVNSADTEFNLTTNWQKFSYTIDIPSISGKTLGTDGNDYLASRFLRAFDSTNPTATVFISRVSVVLGDATAEDDPFSPKHIEEEISLCQRYFEKSYNLDVDPGTVTGLGRTSGYATGIGIADYIKFNTRKQGIPTITLNSPVTGNTPRIRDYSSGVDLTSSSASDIGETGFRYHATAAASDNAYGTHFTADSEL